MSTTPKLPTDDQTARVPDAGGYVPPKPPPPALPCSDCRDILRTNYFALMGRPVCAKCKAQYQAKIDRGTGPAAMRRAIVYGSAAALAGAALLGVVVLGFGFGRIPLAIGIAYLVAKAIGKATGDYGGRRYQILAVTLTYFAIGLGSLSPVLRAARELETVKVPPKQERRTGPAGEMAAIHDELYDAGNAILLEEEMDEEERAQLAAELAQADSAARLERARDAIKSRSIEASQADRLTGSLPSKIVGAVVLIVTLPLLSLFLYGIYGAVVSVLAFGYGMKKAWELTELAVDWQIAGPFRVGTGPIRPTIGG